MLFPSAYASSPVPIGPSKVDPRLHWKTLQTDHFLIHYHQHGEGLALRTAVLAERIHARLTQAMQCLPNGKTHIVINDSIDIVNAVATPLLYNQIYVYPTPPVLGFGHFEDWLESLLVHEYTHILDMGRVEAFAKGIQSVLGKIWFPKAIVSSLFTEGYAVYNETYYTNGGRARDPYTDMLLRESFLADDVPTLDQLLFWGIYPGGNHPYTYGSAFFRFMSDKYDDSSTHTFQRYLARDLWPWDFDSAALTSTVRPLGMLWEEWKQESTQRYQQQKAAIHHQGITVSEPRTTSKSFKWNPMWGPTGERLYYFSANNDAQPEIRQIHLRSRRDASVMRLHTLTNQPGFTLSPDGTQLAFFQIGFYRSFSVYNDLWIRDLRQGRTKRLTHGDRVRDPAWSPDGKTILGVKNERGNAYLVSVDLKSRQVRVLQPETTDLRFSEPSWAPKGDHFSVSAWQEDGYQDIWIFDAQGRSGYPLLHDKAWDVSPCWTPDAKYVLFASDRTGVYNLFAYRFETGQLYQVTNVLGGAFDPSVSPDGTQIAFVSYSSDGFNVHTMKCDPAAWKPVQNILLTSPLTDLFFVGYDTQISDADDVLKVHVNQPTSSQVHSYHSLPTLFPCFWIPYPAGDESGVAMAAITAGRDVLGKHTYVASAQYGLLSKRLSYTFQYINDQFYPSLAIALWDTPEIIQFRKSLSSEFLTWYRSHGASAQVYLPHITVGYQQGFSLGIEAEKSAFQDWPHDAKSPFAGQLVDLFVGWSFGNTHRYPRAISRTNGIELSFIYRDYLARLGGAVNLSEFLADARVYWGMPFDRHVLAWKGSIAYNSTNLPKFYFQFNELTIRSLDKLYVGNLFLSTMEYRFPVVEIQRGWQNLPLFLEQLHGAFFADFARSLSSSSNNQLAIGGEIRLDAIAGYLLRSTLRLSLAMGIKPERTPRFWIQVGEAF